MMETTFRFAGDLEREALNKVAVSLSSIPETEKVIVFGSRVRGDFSGFSDWDVLVVITDIAKRHSVIHELHEIELEYDIPLSPVLMTTKEYEMNRKLKSSFIENIEKEGVVIYDAHR